MITEREKRLMLAAFQYAYSRGHEDTVEGVFNFGCRDDDECFEDWLADFQSEEGHD